MSENPQDYIDEGFKINNLSVTFKDAQKALTWVIVNDMVNWSIECNSRHNGFTVCRRSGYNYERDKITVYPNISDLSYFWFRFQKDIDIQGITCRKTITIDKEKSALKKTVNINAPKMDLNNTKVLKTIVESTGFKVIRDVLYPYFYIHGRMAWKEVTEGGIEVYIKNKSTEYLTRVESAGPLKVFEILGKDMSEMIAALS